jgi:hypothetical protein
MDDKELESLRDLYAGLAMLGMVSRGAFKDFGHNDGAVNAFGIADSMLEARTAKEGIVSVKSPVPQGE